MLVLSRIVRNRPSRIARSVDRNCVRAGCTLTAAPPTSNQSPAQIMRSTQYTPGGIAWDLQPASEAASPINSLSPNVKDVTTSAGNALSAGLCRTKRPGVSQNPTPYSAVDPASSPTTTCPCTSCKTVSESRSGWPAAILAQRHPTLNHRPPEAGSLAARSGIFESTPAPSCVGNRESSLRVVARGDPPPCGEFTTAPRRLYLRHVTSQPPSLGPQIALIF